MTEPKYKPIIFSAPMVMAILEGRKTQTRRIVKVQPPGEGYVLAQCVSTTGPRRNEGRYRWVKRNGHELIDCSQTYCSKPYAVGDRLWVRESWRIGAWDENNGKFAIDYCDGPRKEWIDVPESTEDYLGEGVFEHYWMQCSDELSKKGILPDSDGQYHWEHGKSPLRWRPSIHMPRWASRITLEVTGVRVERLQDISGPDCWAEGIECAGWDSEKYGSVTHCYRDLWESINGPGSWEKNPWVWVVEFKRVEDK